MRFFITGTDTDAGKTYVTCLLLDAMKQRGMRAAGFKPFCCGSREDSIRLHAVSMDGLTLDEINPVWLKTAAAPFAAALIENRTLALDELHAAYSRLAQKSDHTLIEGVGGWEVPIKDGVTAADFAQEMGLPVLVVVNSKLGALNHTLLTVRNIEARGMSCLGVVLNYAAEGRDAASITNGMTLQRMGVHVLGEVMHGETDGAELLGSVEQRMMSLGLP
ncbi:cobyrinic acid a,c-diamide synthase [Verrucomicrobiaceae bacterium SCGC AG-212-N21]|nr:cobyrinic acid a,c-diamide synthase [Verrucomicrobiaceae bacterium SCGC AG-212-N21]